MEKEYESKEYIVFLYCDNCGTEMKLREYKSIEKPSLLFEYVCPKCEHKERSKISYPYTKHKPIEENFLNKSETEFIIDNSVLWKMHQEGFQIVRLEPLKNGECGKILEWEDGEFTTIHQYNGFEKLDYERDVNRLSHNSKVIIVK